MKMQDYRQIYVRNPVTIYLLVWIVACFICETKFSYLIDGIHEDFLWFLITTFFCFFCGWLIVFFMDYIAPNNKIKLLDDICIINELTMTALKIWAFIEFVQIVIFGGVPIVWSILGLGKNYQDFGIHGINGFVNSLYMTIELNFAFLYGITQNKKYLKFFLALMIWPIISMSRQIFMSCILEFFIVYFTFNKLSQQIITKTLAWFCIIMFLFGEIGDLRSGGDIFKDLAQPRYEVLQSLPSGVLWFGIYIATPVANLQNTYEHVAQDDSYVHTFEKLIPTIFREKIQGQYALLSDMTEDTGLITPVFNVSSYMHPPLLDQGPWFVYLITFFLGAFGGKIYFMAKAKCNYMFISANAVFNMMVLLSVFDNLFFVLPITFQFVILWMFNKLMVRRNG